MAVDVPDTADEKKSINMQFNQEDGRVTHEVATGNADENAVTGDTESAEALARMSGKVVNVNLTTLQGTTAQKQEQILKLEEAITDKTDGTEMGIVYGATEEEVQAMRRTLADRGIEITSADDSSQALNRDVTLADTSEEDPNRDASQTAPFALGA